MNDSTIGGAMVIQDKSSAERSGGKTEIKKGRDVEAHKKFLPFCCFFKATGEWERDEKEI